MPSKSGLRGQAVFDRVQIGGSLDARATVGRAPPRQADVLRHLEEPGVSDLGLEAPHQAATRVEIRRLNRVLGLLGRAQLREAVRVDAPVMLGVEILGEPGLGGGEGFDVRSAAAIGSDRH
jgi:hypothetical protein